MTGDALLVANRGEIAVRILRAAAELGLRTVAVYSDDDERALHVRRADTAVALGGSGAGPYLDAERLVDAAVRTDCRMLHPGYGFLAERPELADACAARDVVFVGPTSAQLAMLGDKVRARALAEECGIPVLRATRAPATMEDARRLLEEQPAGHGIMLKAVHGGGGRGARPVFDPAGLAPAFERCASEAGTAFGSRDLFAEELLRPARHVEVQVLGDGAGGVTHLWERDCSLQRRRQKLIEVAPAVGLDPEVRSSLLEAAVRMARAIRFRGAGTFEFLVRVDDDAPRIVFLESNPRLQVEHPVTEAVTGHDLVKAQLGLALGRSLADLGLSQECVPLPLGVAVEVRVNAERLGADGSALPVSGVLTRVELPSGPGVRVDTATFSGLEIGPHFDPLLAKVIAHVPHGSLADALARADRALGELVLDGIETNVAFVRTLLCDPAVVAGAHTTFVDGHLAASARGAERDTTRTPTHGTMVVRAPMRATVVSVDVSPGAAVRRGQALVVLEAMKMEHLVEAGAAGVVTRIEVAAGDAVAEDAPLLWIEPSADVDDDARPAPAIDLAHVRADLAESIERHALTLDQRRPEAVARRRATRQRTARENVDDLCDPGSFVEYGALVVAAQRRRRDLDDLIRSTPADGLVTGIGRVNGDLFGPEASRCAVLAYDYTVLAGTQGLQNHRKKDRLLELAEAWRLPVVLFAEGGGGRPGDTDSPGGSGLDVLAFRLFARLSGLVPVVGIASGRCFAGNAALLGCCDVVIATANASIGMAGPAMIEGGGLGVVHPDAVGPMRVQVPNGVVDVPVADEAEAVEVAKRHLAFFQGRLTTWECADQRRLRSLVPENRLRAYDVHGVIETLADTGSLLELRSAFGRGMVTALARIEGRPLGIVANDPTHRAGAIDSDGADKASRFMQLCDAFDLPLVFLCDTPGIMVGPDAETTALVRHAARMFVVGASLTVPCCTIVLRKGYGLGAMAMAAGTFKATAFTVAWPTGEFGGMGLEGAVKLGFRRELEAIDDPAQRQATYERLVARLYEHGKALSTASFFEIDDVIDPADTRRRIVAALDAAGPPESRSRRKRPCVDTW